MADNITRCGIIDTPEFMQQITVISVKQLYGWTTLFGCAFLLILLLFDIRQVRSTFKKIPYWNALGREMRREVMQWIRPSVRRIVKMSE